MKKILPLLVCLVLALTGCGQKKTELLVDELFVSKHVVAPPLKSTIRFTPPMVKADGEPTPLIDTIDAAQELCFKRTRVSHSDYLPKLVIRINKQGKMQAYYSECWKKKEGYFETTLSDSMISYFNDQLYKMNYKEYKNTVYDVNDGGIYCGPEYFVYIRNGKKIKMDLCLDSRPTPRNIITMIDSMYNYLSGVKLKESPSSWFRKDTLIVLKTEAYLDSTESWCPY